MRIPNLVLLCAFLLPAQYDIQKTVSPDPEHETVELENDQVRVLRVRIPPKSKSVMHPHPNRVVIPLTLQRSRATTATGSVEERSRKPGEVFWGTANIHMTENLSNEPLETLIIEIKPQK